MAGKYSEIIEEKEGLLHCPTCARHIESDVPYRAPHQRPRYWIITAILHLTALSIVFASGYTFNHRHSAKSEPGVKSAPAQTRPVDHNAHLIGSPQAPLNHHEQIRLESVSAEYWDNASLWFGEPTYESDRAWNKLIYPRNFKFTREEAARLNITESLEIRPNNEFGGMLAVMHNLHCLRRVRQMMYTDYYYPEATKERLKNDMGHTLHCLESIRTSMMCYPDINPHPYYWTGDKYHPVSITSKVTRKCVNWEALQKTLEPRNFPYADMIEGTGPPH